MNVTALWEQLLTAICRPHRVEYDADDLAGGEEGTFVIRRRAATREDFVILNKRDQKLMCSSWQLLPAPGDQTPRVSPCVVYCHCNSGSRVDAEEAIWGLLPLGIRVFALDFSGSGQSDGEYVTLGANETNECALSPNQCHSLECLIEFVRAGGHTSTIALWGRSMGAVTALMYARRDPSIAGIVLDSPFSKLTDLMWELVEEQKIPMRRYLGGAALRLMRRSVKKRAGFDINTLSPIDNVHEAFTPALFGLAVDDTFVRPIHTERLHAAYAGDKDIIRFQGNHNSKRPRLFYDAASCFLQRVLQVPGRASPTSHPVTTTAVPPPPAARNGTARPGNALPGNDDADPLLQAALQLSLREAALLPLLTADLPPTAVLSPVGSDRDGIVPVAEREPLHDHLAPESAEAEAAMLEQALRESLGACPAGAEAPPDVVAGAAHDDGTVAEADRSTYVERM